MRASLFRVACKFDLDNLYNLTLSFIYLLILLMMIRLTWDEYVRTTSFIFCSMFFGTSLWNYSLRSPLNTDYKKLF